jgi:adenosylhomocysteine nucleosidase
VIVAGDVGRARAAPARVALVAPMPRELRPLVRGLGLERGAAIGGVGVHEARCAGADVVAFRTGIGRARARAATRGVLSVDRFDEVVVVGIAGGLAPASAIGDLVVPAEVVDASSGVRHRAGATGPTTRHGVLRTGEEDAYALDDDDVARLVGQGVTALDMETSAVVEVCEDLGVPWVVFRAVSDMAGSSSLGPVVPTLVDGDGRPRLPAVGRYLLTHPHRVPDVVRLGRDARRAEEVAASAAVAYLRDR